MICLMTGICFDSISECLVARISEANQLKVRGLGKKKTLAIEIRDIFLFNVVQFLAQDYVKS